LGIDVSEHWLDIGFGSQGPVRRIANATEAIESLMSGLEAAPGLIVFEATGRYDRHLRRVLLRHGQHFARVAPGRARDFARALGLHAKTDAIDARMLAAMGERLDLPATVPVAASREDWPCCCGAATSSSPCASKNACAWARPHRRKVMASSAISPSSAVRSPPSRTGSGSPCATARISPARSDYCALSLASAPSPQPFSSA
jgi:hypothetical protein